MLHDHNPYNAGKIKQNDPVFMLLFRCFWPVIFWMNLWYVDAISVSLRWTRDKVCDEKLNYDHKDHNLQSTNPIPTSVQRRLSWASKITVVVLTRPWTKMSVKILVIRTFSIVRVFVVSALKVSPSWRLKHCFAHNSWLNLQSYFKILLFSRNQNYWSHLSWFESRNVFVRSEPCRGSCLCRGSNGLSLDCRDCQYSELSKDAPG